MSAIVEALGEPSIPPYVRRVDGGRGERPAARPAGTSWARRPARARRRGGAAAPAREARRPRDARTGPTPPRTALPPGRRPTCRGSAVVAGHRAAMEATISCNSALDEAPGSTEVPAQIAERA